MSRDSTGLKLGIAFGCLVALIVGVGWLGLSRMGQINASANQLFNEHWEKLYITRRAAADFNSGYRIAIRAFLTGPKDKAKAAALVANLQRDDLEGFCCLERN